MIASTLDLSDFIPAKQLKEVSQEELLQLKYQIACIAKIASQREALGVRSTNVRATSLEERKQNSDTSSVAKLEQEVRELMASVPMYHVSHRGGLDLNEWDAREITQDDLDIVAPGGIHCADDIRESGWLFDSPHNGHLGTRLSEELEYEFGFDKDDEYEY